MTNNEALGILHKGIAPNPTANNECIELCKKAIEKQIPKKPTFEGDGYDDSGNIIYDTWICPCCGYRYEVDYEMHNHCPTCGQTIGWSDTE